MALSHSNSCAQAAPPDFSRGASPNSPTPRPPRSRARRVARGLGWVLAALLALMLAAAAALWLWAGRDDSLAQTLARAARYLPAEQALQARGVSGSVRAGGTIEWLRWSSPTLAVEVHDATIGWQLRPLLARTLRLGEVHARSITITPLGHSSEPTQPLEQLTLPLQIDIPFRADTIVWASASPVTVQDLAGHYVYDGAEHRLRIDSLALAQGRYSGKASLQALSPMALQADLQGALSATPPGGGHATTLAAKASIKGTLAGKDAQLHANAQVDPTLQEQAAGAVSTQPRNAMQARLQAAIAPWASQPLLQAQATLKAVNTAAFWPTAPATALSGTVQIEPAQGAGDATGWRIAADLRNTLPGPWDAQRLPLDSLQARADFDGHTWTVPEATARLGAGAVALQGHYLTEGPVIEGHAKLTNLRPDQIHTAFDAAPLSGQLRATSQNDAVRFSADIRAASASRSAKAPRNTALHIDLLQAEGQWKAPLLQLPRLHIDALQAKIDARQLAWNTHTQAGSGQLQAHVPGAHVQAQGQLASASGKGELALHISDAARLQVWAQSLPGPSALLHGAALQGTTDFKAQWNGGWQTLQAQLQKAGLLEGKPAAATAQAPFTLNATLNAPNLQASTGAAAGDKGAALRLQFKDLRAELSGSLAQAALQLSGEVRNDAQHLQWQSRATLGNRGPGQWHAEITQLRAQARTGQQPGPWTFTLGQPLQIDLQQSAATGMSAKASASQASLIGPRPGTVALQWQPVQWTQRPGATPYLHTEGTLRGLPMGWADALGANGQSMLETLGVGGDIVIDGSWSIDAGDTLRARAELHRASGDLRILAVDAAPTNVVITSTGQGVGADSAQTAASGANGSGTPAGLREAVVRIDVQGEEAKAQLRWDSERAGVVRADAQTRLTLPGGQWTQASLPPTAPLAGTVQAQLPDVGVWSALAPPGWRVRGSLQAQATLAGQLNAPLWRGTVAADQLAVRSLIEGVDLQDGQLRATLQGDRLEITQLRIAGGRGSRARIAGFSGNRTAAARDGGELTATGQLTWGSGLGMDIRAQARALQVLVRADRQVSISGPLQARLQQGQVQLRGQLTIDRATIILPDETAPQLGSDVVVRSVAIDRANLEKAQKAAKSAARAETTQPLDLQVTLNLGDDFALQGHGITTRLEGELQIFGNPVPGAAPRIVGEVRTVQGRYRAWGQALNVETGLIRFSGAMDNPALDILALRPNIPVRAGVQVTGSARSPRVRLYSEPDLPDAEKLSWVVMGRDAAAGGAEAAVLQQAALAFLSGGGGNDGAGNFAQRLGFDEIGLRGPADGESASSAALTLGKRLSKDLYVTYERSLSGAMGTLYIFYDLSRRLKLRGQTGEKSAIDIIYTMRYD